MNITSKLTSLFGTGLKACPGLENDYTSCTRQVEDEIANFLIRLAPTFRKNFNAPRNCKSSSHSRETLDKHSICLEQGIGKYISMIFFHRILIIGNREQDKEATVYIGNIDERVTDSLVWELMLQAGRIVNVHLPKDRVTQTHQGYGFVEFISEEDAEYAARVMNQVRLYGKPIRVNKVL